MPFPVALVGMNLRTEMQIRLGQHLKILAPATFQLTATLLNLLPPGIGEGNSLRTRILAHAAVWQTIDNC